MNTKINEVIDSLKRLTSSQEFLWMTVKDYLNSNWNDSLKHYIINNNEYYDVYQFKRPYLVEKDSYCVNINDGIAYLYNFKYDKGDYLIFALQSSNSSNILELNNRSTIQGSLEELYRTIQNQFDDINPLIELIISKSQKTKE